eukprot:568058-Hanusia_phi.AAC.1
MVVGFPLPLPPLLLSLPHPSPPPPPHTTSSPTGSRRAPLCADCGEDGASESGWEEEGVGRQGADSQNPAGGSKSLIDKERRTQCLLQHSCLVYISSSFALLTSPLPSSPLPSSPLFSTPSLYPLLPSPLHTKGLEWSQEAAVRRPCPCSRSPARCCCLHVKTRAATGRTCASRAAGSP